MAEPGGAAQGTADAAHRAGRGQMAKIKVKTPVVELLAPRQSAASAAFSVALGRIAADALAGSGR